MSNNFLTKTPCIGICSTTYGDEICRGCKRFSHEVTSRIKYTDSEKDNVNRRLQKFKKLILSDKFSIIDEQLLRKSLDDAKIMYNDKLEPICWLFDLFRALSQESLNLSTLGIAFKASYSKHSISELKELINKEFFELSTAHYQRYIKNIKAT